MTSLSWQIRRNLENSLAEFLQDQASSLTVFYKGANQAIDIRVGNAPQQSWSMPNISVYLDTRTAPRGFVGNNKRLKTYLMIIDVRALDDGMRSDLAEWVSDTINDGFDVYDYTPNIGDPENPNKTLSGKASIAFVSDVPIRNTQNTDIFEKFRQNISVNITIAV
jgi:hypothetical protein